jgi:hypothetical protein
MATPVDTPLPWIEIMDNLLLPLFYLGIGIQEPRIRNQELGIINRESGTRNQELGKVLPWGSRYF